VTAGTALIDEEFQALLLFRSERVGIATEILIEGGIRRDERRFERRDGGHHVGHGDSILVAWKRGLKKLRVTGNALEHLEGMLMGYPHFDGILDRTTSLRLQVSGTPIPELRHVENGVQHRRRVAPPFCHLCPIDVGNMSGRNRL
jgi:hypothetical protein